MDNDEAGISQAIAKIGQVPAQESCATKRKAHASGEFGCHKACDLNEDAEDYSGVYEPNKKTPHCAGALIFLEKQDAPHRMMRICERLGSYDRRKLDMNAPVVSSPKDCKRRPRNKRGKNDSSF